MKLLLKTNDPTVIAFAQAMLDGEGIASFVLDVHMSVFEGSIGILPRRLMVAERDHFRAAASLTSRERNAMEWADTQFDIAWSLDDLGRASEVDGVGEVANDKVGGSDGRSTMRQRVYRQ